MDLSNGIQALQHYISSTWWQWKLGSALLFWRFPTEESRKAARDGWPVWRIDGVDLPDYKRKQRAMPTDIAQQLAVKIAKVRKNNYITPCGPTLSDVDYFGTIKIRDVLATGKIKVIDIRVVYDATASGLNNAIWAPNFWLPSIDCALRGMNFGSWAIDFDLGDMFLNFPLPQSLRPYVGIRMEQLHDIIESMEGQPLIWTWESWVRYLMGFTASPFCTIKTYYHAEEFVIGDPKEKGSPVRWDRVIVNCIGSPSFDPRLPMIMKWDDERNCIAGECSTFVDNGRCTGKDDEHAWQVSQRYTQRLQFLGIQNAPRNTRPPGNIEARWSLDKEKENAKRQ